MVGRRKARSAAPDRAGSQATGSVKKAPLLLAGPGDSHAARAAGWYPAPAHIPNSGRWNWFRDGRPLLPGRAGTAGTVWRCPVLLLGEGAPHPPSPEGPPPRAEA